MKLNLPSKTLSGNTLILLVSLVIVAGGNLTFFSNVLKTYSLSGMGIVYFGSLAIVLTAITALLFSLVCFGRLTKPILVVFLLLSSLAAYFMDSYGVVINDEMLRNAIETNAAETFDLLTGKLVLYFVLLGVLPAFIISRFRLKPRSFGAAFRARAIFIVVLVGVIGALIAASGPFYASFLREHKSLRSYANPTYFTYSSVRLVQGASAATGGTQTVAVLGEDARIPETDQDRELIFLVVGETARADHFSLNGYERDTNPRLREAKAVSFSNVWSCGTSTAVSVPCMFSMGGMDKFDVKTAGSKENLLDVLRHAGVNVLWLENNSDSKGVAIRSDYRNFKSRDLNPVCDEECRDEGMLVGLQDYIDSHPKGDIVVVMHQMGNHGPAYFKRYPPAFEKFTPACKSNDLSQCSNEEIRNAYDNAILYTDHFLGKAIDVLKHNDDKFETALLYLSDHGESLGENGIYLHGLPRAVAPEAQVHIPAVMWTGKGFAHEIDEQVLQKKRQERFTHDSVPHTVLGLMEIQTKLYRPDLDILNGTRRPE